jgi:general secretion pathway protein G
VIDKYAIDNGAFPQTLDDVVTAGYINQIPEDPITKKPNWKIVVEEKILRDTKRRGIVDVRSSSTATSSEGSPYSTW